MLPTFHLSPITPDDARIFCGWRYGPGYALYDMSPADEGPLLTPEFRYHAVRRDAALVGFACFGEDAQVYGGPYAGPGLDIGCGLDPALCSRGQGAAFLAAITDFASRTFAPPLLRLTVAGSNLRAIRAYERSGFEVKRRFAGMTRGGIYPFLLMTKNVT
jgi:RimJ/RimL family protein N-acetyltransferase